MDADAQYWMTTLGLQAHPEGGYYAETYRAAESVAAAALPERFGGDRAFSTAIYFLLVGNQVSRLHRIASDELWHFYAGAALELFQIDPTGKLSVTILGPDAGAGQTFQAVVPAETYFGAAVVNASGYALVGCTVAPGFVCADFELGDRAVLLAAYPQHQQLIEQLTSGD